MKKTIWLISSLMFCAVTAWAQQNNPVQSQWAQWRGPAHNGVARGDAPTERQTKHSLARVP